MIDKLLILVTPTYKRSVQAALLNRCAATFRDVPSLIWLVIEDANEINPDIQMILSASGINYKYWAAGKTNDKGHHQRNSAYEYIRKFNIQGIIYNADDDNIYHPDLFTEIVNTKKIGVLPVGNLGPHGPTGVERPRTLNKKIIGWDSGWPNRIFPIDMAGFAFHSSLLMEMSPPLWAHVGVGGESEFLSRIATSQSEFELLANDCQDVLVWHNAAQGLIQPNDSRVTREHYKI